MKYFRVKFGYGKNDFYSIPETDLAKALRAQVRGTVFMCEEGTIAGNNIMAISPDYNKLMGYNPDYQLTGEDYSEIGTAAVKEHRIFLQKTRSTALGNTETKLLSHD